MPQYVEHPTRTGRWRDGGFEVLPQPDLAVIAAEPVFAYDLNFGDEMEVAGSAEGPLVAVRPVHDAGRFTFRVLFPDAGDPDDRSWVALQQDLEPFGCWFDVYTPQLVAVSAEADVAQAVADVLADEQRTGRWVYETGRSVLPGTRH